MKFDVVSDVILRLITRRLGKLSASIDSKMSSCLFFILVKMKMLFHHELCFLSAGH